MPSASTTASSLEERCRRIAEGPKRPYAPAVLAIDIEDLTVGDRLMVSGSPFTVEHIQPDGPVVKVMASAGTRTIHVDYLRIERVDIVHDLMDGQHRLAVCPPEAMR